MTQDNEGRRSDLERLQAFAGRLFDACHEQEGPWATELGEYAYQSFRKLVRDVTDQINDLCKDKT